MKLSKEVKVAKEEVEFEAGTYYWNDIQQMIYKITVSENEDFQNYADYRFERLTLSGNILGIKVIQEYDDMGNLPWEFQQFIFSGRKREITEEEFNKEKKEILERL